MVEMKLEWSIIALNTIALGLILHPIIWSTVQKISNSIQFHPLLQGFVLATIIMIMVLVGTQLLIMLSRRLNLVQ